MSKKVKERVAGKQIADVMIELSAKIIRLEEDLSSEIWHRKDDADKITALESDAKRIREQAVKVNFEAAQANIAEGKVRAELKDMASKFTTAADERLTLRGRVVDLQAEINEARAQHLKADADAREAWKMSSNFEGALSIAKGNLERVKGIADNNEKYRAEYYDKWQAAEKLIRSLKRKKAKR